MNVLHGPWEEREGWKKMQNGMENHFKEPNRSNAVFLALVYQIADDRRQSLTSEPGSDEEQQQVWELIQQGPCLSSLGSRVAMKTWFEFVKVLRERNAEFHTYRDCLCIV